MQFLAVPKEEIMEQSDKETVLRRLMDEFGNDVLRTATLYLKSRHNAEDAFQEVFIKVFNKLNTFKRESSEKTWILTITMNVCRDMLRSAWQKRVMLNDELSSYEGHGEFEEDIIKKDEQRKLFQEITKLKPAFREVIILYYYQGYDTSEVGKILKCAEGTVRSRLHRAREILKSKIGGRLQWSD